MSAYGEEGGGGDGAGPGVRVVNLQSCGRAEVHADGRLALRCGWDDVRYELSAGDAAGLMARVPTGWWGWFARTWAPDETRCAVTHVRGSYGFRGTRYFRIEGDGVYVGCKVFRPGDLRRVREARRELGVRERGARWVGAGWFLD